MTSLTALEGITCRELKGIMREEDIGTPADRNCPDVELIKLILSEPVQMKSRRRREVLIKDLLEEHILHALRFIN